MRRRQPFGCLRLSLSKKSSESWAFSFARGKIAIGGEKDAGTREDGSQCDRDGGNRWPGTRGAFNSYNSEIEEIRENQIEHITKRQEFDDQMKFLQLKTDALSEMRPKIKMQKFNKLIEFAKDIPSLKKDAFVLRGTFLMKSGKSQTRAIEDLIEGFSSLHTVNEDSAVSKTTEYILENGLIPGTSDHDIEQLVKNIFEKRKKRLDKKHQCLVKSVAKLVAQQGS